jgi:hypothetical protein
VIKLIIIKIYDIFKKMNSKKYLKINDNLVLKQSHFVCRVWPSPIAGPPVRLSPTQPCIFREAKG